MKRLLIFVLILSSLFCLLAGPIESEIVFADDQVVDVPILMYHSILKSRRGQYIISPDDLKNDLLWLKEHRYESVFVSDLINFCEGNGDLPEKPVVITFDDGHYNNYYYAKPIFEELQFKATINIVGT